VGLFRGRIVDADRLGAVVDAVAVLAVVPMSEEVWWRLPWRLVVRAFVQIMIIPN
jgi:hypothetical protein